MEECTYEYFMSELSEFWKMMGSKKYWALDDNGTPISRALKGLVFLYSRLSKEDVDKIGNLWNAALINYDMVSSKVGVV